MSQKEAMEEYVKLYNKITGEKDEDLISAVQSRNLDFSDWDIPDEYEGSNFYSSTAKQAKEEINQYLINVSETEKLFYKIREQIYNGDIITPQNLSKFAEVNNFNCIYLNHF